MLYDRSSCLIKMEYRADFFLVKLAGQRFVFLLLLYGAGVAG